MAGMTPSHCQRGRDLPAHLAACSQTAVKRDSARAEDLDITAEDHACFSAGTLVDTEDGPRPIETLDGWSGLVRTIGGAYTWAYGSLTRKAASVVRVTFEDGTGVTCTPDHRFMSAGGTWVPCLNLVDALRERRRGAMSERTVGVRSIEDAGRADVYCLTVPATEAFCIEGGLIVHNCDALRYGCLYRSWVKIEPKPDTRANDRGTSTGRRRSGNYSYGGGQWAY
jgi:hypothetical protein